jgi:N6-L-threonylcarbamoyladenine synthase
MAAAVETRANAVLLGGGVVANSRLRTLMAQEADRRGIRLVHPSIELCTDNAAMIASAGFYRLKRGERSSLDMAADPGLPLR